LPPGARLRDNQPVTSHETYLAADLGAGSGRVMAGSFDGSRLELEEIHRFQNPGVRILDSLHWDALHLFEEIKRGMHRAAERRPVSVGVDTWGVDYALLDRTGALIGNPYHYRDGHKAGAMARAFDVVPKRKIFEHTGIQFMEINTLYQLFSMKDSPALAQAERLLMMPDLFHYWLTGVQVCELTDASTTQFYDPRKKTWASELLDALGLPASILGGLVDPGTKIGALRPSVLQETGLGPMQVVAPGGHDTASAVAAVPAEGEDWAYLSSGTWSLLGAETQTPYVTDAALERNFTNEAGAAGTTRLLTNIPGMWLLEECRRHWALSGSAPSYDEIIHAAHSADSFRSLIDVDDPDFEAPDDMPSRLQAWCRGHREPEPDSAGQFARMIFESLALRYRRALDDLAAVTGRRAKTLHIVGGGSRNDLLSQFAADACQVEVVAGPVEATAAGNVLIQAMGMGRIRGVSELREVIRRSFELKRFHPKTDGARWAEAAERLGS